MAKKRGQPRNADSALSYVMPVRRTARCRRLSARRHGISTQVKVTMVQHRRSRLMTCGYDGSARGVGAAICGARCSAGELPGLATRRVGEAYRRKEEREGVSAERRMERFTAR